MIRIFLLWFAIATMSFSFGVDTIVVHQLNNNYRITGKVPQFSVEKSEDRELMSYLKDINRDINNNFSELKREVISEALQFSNDFPNSNLLPFTLNSSYVFTSTSDAKLYSLLVETTYYTGGAHATHIYKGYTLDEKRKYKLDDFFKDPKGGRKYMTQAIEEKIRTSLDQSKAQGKPIMFFEEAKVNLDDATFYVREDNIIILFSQYVISPYSSGKQEFIFSFKELAPFLNKRWTDL